MPYQEDNEITKRYYTMGEVSELFGVNASQVRFYEKEFEILQPKKNKKGNRLFTAEDVENLKIIFHLVKEKEDRQRNPITNIPLNQNHIEDKANDNTTCTNRRSNF